MSAHRLTRSTFISLATGGLLAAAGVAVLVIPQDPPPVSRVGRMMDEPLRIRVDQPKQRTDPKHAQELSNVADLEKRSEVDALVQVCSGPAGSPEQARLRYTALQALANVGGEKAFGHLRHVMADPTRELIVRLGAASALARRGGEPELNYLRERLKTEPSKIVREKIRLSLEARKA